MRRSTPMRPSTPSSLPGNRESAGCIAIPMISSSSIEAREFARAAALGLSDHPRWLPCRYLYDAEGSRLFERITETPEHYLTRTERSVLDESSDAIAQITGDGALVELGAGSARKTERILSAYTSRYGAARYVPGDVSGAALAETTRAVAGRYPPPALAIRGVH